MTFGSRESFLSHLADDIRWTGEDATRSLERKNIPGYVDGIMKKAALEMLLHYESKDGCCAYHESVNAMNRKEYCKN